MGRAHDTRRCVKRTCCRSGKGRFAACSGRNSTGIFFFSSYLFISSSFFFTFCVSTSGLNTITFFISVNAPGGALCPIFVLKNAPGTLQTPRGRYFGIVLWNAPGGVYSGPFFTVCLVITYSKGKDQPGKVAILLVDR